MAGRSFGDTASLEALLRSLDDSEYEEQRPSFKRKFDDDELMTDEEFAACLPLVKVRRDESGETFPLNEDPPLPGDRLLLPGIGDFVGASELRSGFIPAAHAGILRAGGPDVENSLDFNVLKAFSAIIHSGPCAQDCGRLGTMEEGSNSPADDEQHGEDGGNMASDEVDAGFSVDFLIPDAADVGSGHSGPVLIDENSAGGEMEISNGIVSKQLHFFVRTFPDSRTLVLHADSSDTVGSLHEEIERRMGIPLSEQRLIYSGKQLFLDHTLAECGIEKDSELHLVGRIRSTSNYKSWQLANEIVSSTCRMISGNLEPTSLQNVVPRLVSQFLKMHPSADADCIEHRRVFQYSGAPLALCMLYVSPIDGNRECAEECIRLFLAPELVERKEILACYASVLLDICKRLACIAHDSCLYASCRHALALSLESIGGLVHGSEHFDDADPHIMTCNLITYVNELGSKLESSFILEPFSSSTLSNDLGELTAFMRPLRQAIEDCVGYSGRNPIPVQQLDGARVIKESYFALMDVLSRFHQLLNNMEDLLNQQPVMGMRKIGNEGAQKLLLLLGEFDNLCKIFAGETEKLYRILKSRRMLINSLVQCVKRGDDHLWILDHKGILEIDVIEHLLFALFPDVEDEQLGEPYELLIERSKLLEVSYEYVGRSSPNLLKRELLIGFKDEEATGPGVIREWFHLVCNELFDPHRPLFMACPDDKRRFFPNPASNVDPMHLQYFMFCGRMIAMALMHRVKVNVVFARSFVLNLAGKRILLEDIKDEEQEVYKSCKWLLEMDAEFLDSGDLALSFFVEYEDMGSWKSVELCPGGKNISVNSRNREHFVDLLIEHRFSKRIFRQVTHFSQGFSDILNTPRLSGLFFRTAEPGILDLMLYGGERDISVDEWKAHTNYNGYLESDCQIVWFWQVVENMSVEQQQMLLSFWISLHHLPAKGFAGLDTKLQIYKHDCSADHLPSSHTCFYQLMLPPYPSFSIMNDRLRLICQKHIAASFGMA